jgi:oligopeptidase B
MTAPLKRAAPALIPIADRKPEQRTLHGVALRDDYAWLRAGNWQEVMRDPQVLDEKIRAYLEAENAYTASCLADTVALQGQLFKEMKARLKQDDSTVPAADGPFAYFTSFVSGGQYPLVCRRKVDGRKESVLLDGNAEAAGAKYWDLGGSEHSPDHKLLAYSVDDKGSELYTLRFRDLKSGSELDDVIPNTRGDVVWANDSRTVFYVRLDDNHRPLFVYRHRLGTPVADDELVFEETSTGYYVGLDKTQSGRFVLIDSHDHQSNEVYLLDADAPDEAPRLVAKRKKGHQYSVEHRKKKLIITTNSSKAVDFRVCEAPVDAPAMKNWEELIPHVPGRLIIDTVVYRQYMARLERENGLPRIVIRRFKDGREHIIDFDEEAYALGISAGYEFDTTTLRFTYSSLTTPAETFDYDMESRKRKLRKRQEVPSGHEPADYVTRRVYATASDGAQVPISLIHRKDTPIDGTAPLLLYGYGAYGISMPASFSTVRLSLVDRGFVYAIAHIRGGKDKGYAWYTDGKLKHKTNTFSDFIAAGEHLAATGYTTRGRIVAQGGSAGGMLMGAVANMAPDLFLGIIANVPFVDVLNTMLDDSLPLTPPEWLEWGNPIASKADFDKILSYSPYDNVAAKAYPHILAVGGLTDPRVTYWEPAKWVARLRTLNTSDNLLLLKTNMAAGHGGASGRFEHLKEVAVDYAFALKITGLGKEPVRKSRPRPTR